MRQIKIILIILYTLILGFIVFGNTSVFADEEHSKQSFVYSTTSGFDNYWVNMQDKFDDDVTRFNKSGNTAFLNQWRSLSNSVNSFDYVAIPVLNVRATMGLGYSSSDGDLRGYVVYIYNTSTTGGQITSTSDFTYATLNDYYGGYFNAMGTTYDESISFNAVKIPVFAVFGIYNYSNDYEYRINSAEYNYSAYIPLSVYNYYHHVYYSYIDRNNTSGASQITGAINNQTNTIVNETQKQTNQITGTISNATQQQTNQLLDTNDTGNTTLEVNANVTDNSVNLDNFFMSIYNAFTSASGVVTKRLTLKLPNNSDFDVVVRSDMLSNFFENNTIFKVFYQAFWWVSLGGYVIFDVKRMYNLVMIGKWDVLHLIDKPTDVVVDLSTGGSGKGGSIY